MGYLCPLFPASPSLSSWFIQRNAVDIKEQRWLDTKKQGGTRLPKHYSSTGSTQEASGQLRNVTKIQDKNKHGNNSGSITTQIYLSDHQKHPCTISIPSTTILLSITIRSFFKASEISQGGKPLSDTQRFQWRGASHGRRSNKIPSNKQSSTNL